MEQTAGKAIEAYQQTLSMGVTGIFVIVALTAFLLVVAIVVLVVYVGKPAIAFVKALIDENKRQREEANKLQVQNVGALEEIGRLIKTTNTSFVAVASLLESMSKTLVTQFAAQPAAVVSLITPQIDLLGKSIVTEAQTAQIRHDSLFGSLEKVAATVAGTETTVRQMHDSQQIMTKQLEAQLKQLEQMPKVSDFKEAVSKEIGSMLTTLGTVETTLLETKKSVFAIYEKVMTQPEPAPQPDALVTPDATVATDTAQTVASVVKRIVDSGEAV